MSDILELELHKSYVTQSGSVVEIVGCTTDPDNEDALVYLGNDKITYYPNGHNTPKASESDLAIWDPLVSVYKPSEKQSSQKKSLELEVGNTYRSGNGDDVTIIKVIPFSFSDTIPNAILVNSMFYMGDNAKLYTVDGKGVPEHYLNQTFNSVDNLVCRGGEDLPIDDPHPGYSVGHHIAEIKRILSFDGLTPTVTIT